LLPDHRKLSLAVAHARIAAGQHGTPDSRAKSDQPLDSISRNPGPELP